MSDSGLQEFYVRVFVYIRMIYFFFAFFYLIDKCNHIFFMNFESVVYLFIIRSCFSFLSVKVFFFFT